MRFKTFKLFETPDSLYIPLKGELNYWDDSYAFGYYKDKLYVSDINDTHSSIIKYFKRKDFKYAGRIWPDFTAMSFWEYPSTKEFKKIIDDLERELHIDIWDNDYIVEIDPSGKLIPIEDYISSENWSEEERNREHEIPPLLKKNKISDNYWKIRSKKEKPLFYKQRLLTSEHFINPQKI